MTIRTRASNSGIALIIVMVVIVVLGILAGGFAYSMKVETKLARNASVDADLEWLGRSGIEMARYILAIEGNVPGGGQIDSLKAYWAGGPGETNSPLSELSFPMHLGVGEFDRPKIIDCDRKFNINVADERILNQALTLIGVDAGTHATIVDSILDWRDPDDKPRMAGSESDFYQRLSPPYFAKDGALDDLTELLLVNGVTPEIYWGSGSAGHVAMLNKPQRARQSRFEEPIYEIGLVDLFTTTSGRMVNINTASAKVLQIFPEIDENIANAIISGPGGRAGPDGAEGTEDDMPFRSVQELSRVQGFSNPAALGMLSRYFSTRSLMFEVQVTVRAASATRTYVALLRRLSTRDIQIMSLHWK